MNIEKLIKTLKREEGFRSEPYQDANGWSVGYGRWTREKPKPVTKAQAEECLVEDIWFVRDELSTELNWDGLCDARQRVLVEMAFNVGLAGFFKFRKMLAAIEVADWDTAAAEILDSKAARTLPGRYTRLAETMRKGAD